jgi:NAD(P)-dependent dehydrogenase (short-subunit alcohol dehydrogenase family)
MNDTSSSFVALVTGSGRGIGRATAASLLARGARVVINDLDADRAIATAGELGANAVAIPADVSSKISVSEMVNAIVERFGRLDVLVNNAGMDHAAPITDIEEDEWDRFMAVNLKSVYLCSRAVLPAMIERQWGRIVNVSSLVARQGALNGGIHYATTKAGMLGFTRTLARQVAKHGITVNAVAPGVIDTELIRENVAPATREQLIKAIPLGRIGTIKNVGDTIAFLASDEAEYITGATIDINGGLWMG